MSHEAIVGYLREYNAALSCDALIPKMDGLAASEQARVARFLMHAEPKRPLATGVSAVRRTVVAPVVFEGKNGSIGDDSAAKLAEFAAGLQAPITQEGEQ